jgi:hypothetical protein
MNGSGWSKTSFVKFQNIRNPEGESVSSPMMNVKNSWKVVRKAITASYLAMSGASIAEIAEVLGHKPFK